jgi:tetratricopeptide (TPR) repeat protein
LLSVLEPELPPLNHRMSRTCQLSCLLVYQAGLIHPPSAAKAATVSRDTLVTVAELHRRLGELFEILGQYDSAQMQLKEVIAIDERLYGADHPSIIVDLTRLGAVQYRSGRYTDAAQTLSRALVMAERALGPEHQDVAPILATLGNTYNELGRLTDAEPLLKRSLAISLNASVAHDIEIAQALNNLADLYLAKGRLKESERLLLDALVRLHKGDLQPERLPTGQSLVAQLRHDRSSLRAHTDAEVTVLGAVLNNLGCLYHLRHKDTLARDLYQLAIEVKSTASGGDLLGLSTTYSNLSGSLLLSGDVEHALSMSLDACEIDSRTLPAYHPHVAIDQLVLQMFI